MSSFTEWFGDRRARLLRIAGALCRDTQTAQDIVQDVSIKAHRRWDRLEQMDNPEAYLRRMVVNEFVSWRRKWGRVVPAGDLAEIHTTPTVDHAEQISDRQQLRAELDRLPRRQRAVLVLRYYEGLDYATIAGLLHTRPVTVRAYASRALARLRIEMAEDDEAGPTERSPQPPLDLRIARSPISEEDCRAH